MEIICAQGLEPGTEGYQKTTESLRELSLLGVTAGWAWQFGDVVLDVLRLGRNATPEEEEGEHVYVEL